MSKNIPTLLDIYRARKNVYRFLSPTPLHHYTGLSKLCGTDVWVKHENHHPVGAFKVRGGLHLVAGLTEIEQKGGLFSASTGNHGQSIAFAGKCHGVKATITVPKGANPGKVAAMEGMGAEVIHHGPDFDTAREWSMQQAEERNGYFVGPTDTPLIEGVGTYGLEIMESLPDVDIIFVPVGAGSGVCGTAIAAKSLNSHVKVIGVQSSQAPAMQLSWKNGAMQQAEMTTVAEGLATRVPFENTQEIMAKYLDDFMLVDDARMEEAVQLMLQHTHNLAEEAGAAALAAALQNSATLEGKKVVLVQSGGNLSIKRLQHILNITVEK